MQYASEGTIIMVGFFAWVSVGTVSSIGLESTTDSGDLQAKNEAVVNERITNIIDNKYLTGKVFLIVNDFFQHLFIIANLYYFFNKTKILK